MSVLYSCGWSELIFLVDEASEDSWNYFPCVSVFPMCLMICVICELFKYRCTEGHSEGWRKLLGWPKEHGSEHDPGYEIYFRVILTIFRR